jgi:hypothetical protein
MVANDPAVQSADDQGPAATTEKLTSTTDDQRVPDRRRPGRVQYTNRALVGLLRIPVGLKSTQTEDRRDDLAPAKGIMIGLLVAIPFWAALAGLLWYLLRH